MFLCKFCDVLSRCCFELHHFIWCTNRLVFVTCIDAHWYSSSYRKYRSNVKYLHMNWIYLAFDTLKSIPRSVRYRCRVLLLRHTSPGVENTDCQRLLAISYIYINSAWVEWFLKRQSAAARRASKT